MNGPQKSPPPSDPFEILLRLQEARQHPLLGGADQLLPEQREEAAEAAYRVVELQGYCRLFGLTLSGPEAARLPTPQIIAACGHLTWYLQELRQTLDTIEERFLSATCQPEVDDIVCEPWEARMDAHAAFLEIDDAYTTALENDEPDLSLFSQAVDQVLAEMKVLDDALREHLDILSLVTDTNLLDNWRAQLAREYSELPPWWLDGTLEAAADQAQAEVLATLPTAEWWTKLRGASHGEVGRPDVLPRHHIGHWRSLPRQHSLAAAGQEPPPFQSELRWRSPDGAFEARLAVPSYLLASGRTPLRLRFYQSNGKPAAELTSVVCRLNNAVSSIVQASSRPGQIRILAEFELEDLVLPDRDDLALMVRDVEWPAVILNPIN